jgi:hypothetical protein
MRAQRRFLALAVPALIAVAAGLASAKKVARPKPPPPPPPPKEEAVKPPAPTSKSFWEPLVTAGGRWHLATDDQELRGTYIVVEVYDARAVKGGKVARLRWSVRTGSGTSPMGNSLPTQIALTKKGAFLLSDRLDDAGVEKAIKGKPTYADPPKAFVKDDSYVRKDGEDICIGVGTAPGTGKCTDVCHAEFCLGKGVGVTTVSGNYTPDAVSFKAPRPGQVMTELQTGIPECDRVLAEFYRCVSTSPQFDPATQQQLMENFKQFAQGLRQQASTPDGRQQAIQQCMVLEQQLGDYRQSLGCP